VHEILVLCEGHTEREFCRAIIAPAIAHFGIALAGTIVGVVDRPKIIDGSRIKAGDVIIGLASDGLHTNGYSLARKILFEQLGLKITSRVAGLKKTLGEELLRVHRNYVPVLDRIPHGKIKGLAHITGGGLIDNLPRVLPKKCDAAIDTSSWKVPALFDLLCREGGVDPTECYQVFNMGIGMTIIVAAKDATKVLRLSKGRWIGEIIDGAGTVQLH